jgi:GT2 family glycosyltransferase
VGWSLIVKTPALDGENVLLSGGCRHDNKITASGGVVRVGVARWLRGLAAWRRAPGISILVPTDTRAAALDNLLSCLRFLNGPDFEVIVIRGPTDEGMSDVLAKWRHAIKLAKNPERNTSKSRNLGLGLAAGDIIALVDDDGLPEPDWLAELVKAFDDPTVGAAGGMVVDHVGTGRQSPYITVNRLGHMDMSWAAPVDALNVPNSYDFPFAPGVNSAFRRSAFLAVGGFDEAYEYYYDETDLCCRLVDAGWKIRHMPAAAVHHKMLASHIRTDTRIMRDMYPALHGKLYFSLVNNHGHYPESRAREDLEEYVRAHEAHYRNLVATGQLPESDLDRFTADVARAWEIGMRRGLNRERQLLRPETLPVAPAFLPFPRLVPAGGRRRLIFAGEALEAAARAAGALGHHVHLVLPGEGHDRVDFEESIWVHRFLDPKDEVRRLAAGATVAARG